MKLKDWFRSTVLRRRPASYAWDLPYRYADVLPDGATTQWATATTSKVFVFPYREALEMFLGEVDRLAGGMGFTSDNGVIETAGETFDRLRRLPDHEANYVALETAGRNVRIEMTTERKHPLMMCEGHVIISVNSSITQRGPDPEINTVIRLFERYAEARPSGTKNSVVPLHDREKKRDLEIADASDRRGRARGALYGALGTVVVGALIWGAETLVTAMFGGG